MSAFRILVTVGSDHHPYERLVGWADAYAADHPDVHVTIQYGTARAPQHADGSAFVDHAELNSLMSAADAVVMQGGPTGIAECRLHGLLPIVSPRRMELGEHVDNHQRAFAQFLGARGQVALLDSTDESDFRAVLADARTRPEAYRVDPREEAAELAQSVTRFGEIVDALPRPRQHSRLRRRGGRA